MRAWQPWKGVVVACASVTACAAVLGFDASPDLSPYNYIGDTSGEHWQQSSLSPQFLGRQGGAFDGRYVYLAPTKWASMGGYVQRYDTQGDFGVASWSSFSLSPLAADTGFAGAEFDGRYLYFVPEFAGKGLPPNTVFVRYDTKAAYESRSSWETFDVTKEFSKQQNGYKGGAFDGRYLYFAPWPSTYMLRLDTHGAFSSKTSWEVFDLRSRDSLALGMNGVIFDGRYVYVLPFVDGDSNNNDAIARYDPRKPFSDANAWELLHLTQTGFNADAGGYVGGAFDGRYIYLSPYTSYLGTVARFDTAAPAGFLAPASWSFFSVQENLNKNAFGFCGAGFDGRFVYFVPNANVAADGIVARVDSLGDFKDKRSWSTYDMKAVNPAAVQFCGAIFDGQHMYFVPQITALVTRFEARTSPEMPKLPEFFGSFY